MRKQYNHKKLRITKKKKKKKKNGGSLKRLRSHLIYF